MQSSSIHLGITNISIVRDSRFSDKVSNMRNVLMDYLNSDEGVLLWETEQISRTWYYKL